MELVETGVHATVVCPAGVLTAWAGETEGGSMLPFFSASGPVIKRLASERGTSLPAIEGVLPAEDVAGQIVKCIYNPVAELFTHKGSVEFLRLIAGDREEAEAQTVGGLPHWGHRYDPLIVISGTLLVVRNAYTMCTHVWGCSLYNIT